MQNKGAIRLLAIVFALVCLYQLSFTLVTNRVEKKAERYSTSQKVVDEAKQLSAGNPVLERFYFDSLSRSARRFYLDSMSDQVTFNILVRKYTYRECKEKEINLGLDLRGGMNVTLEISVVDIVNAMSGFSKDPVFNQALAQAVQMQRSSQEDFITLFYQAFKTIDPNASLAPVFSTMELKDLINPSSTDEEVLSVLRDETNAAIDRTFEILRTRIDQFGVAQPNIQKLQTTGRILIELPGVKDPERVRKLLQGTAKLEFYETWKFNEILGPIEEANKRIALYYQSLKATTSDSGSLVTTEDTTSSFFNTSDTTALSDNLNATDELLTDSASKANEINLYTYMHPNFYIKDNKYFPAEDAVVGYALIRDTARVNAMLRMESVINVLPQRLKFAWAVKPFKDPNTKKYTNFLQLYALKPANDGKASLEGDVIIDARQDFSQNQNSEITMLMNTKGAKEWKRITGQNVGKSVAIILDNLVYSSPVVRDEIPNGRSSITGDFTIQEAKDLANILKAGKIPAAAHIVEEAVVGPSLGREAINAGFFSFLIAFLLVLIYMALYYRGAGLIADLALVTNVFFLLGVLASLGAVLTLPGIAGIVLTLGMAVDANVIIYERIKEELRQGKGIRLAIQDGYKNAYSAIIDGNITTLLTGIVLFVFGSGPVQGFATTLIIGIITSLFTAIFLSRLIFNFLLDRNKPISFDNAVTRKFLSNVNFDFIAQRKKMYLVSASVIIIGIASLATQGLNFGVDFSGGRNYIVRFDKDVKVNEVRAALTTVLAGQAPEVKTFGPANQVKITTKFMIENDTKETDSIVESKLFDGLKTFYATPITFEDFTSDDESKVLGRLSSQKVGPTIADDIKRAAVLAVLISLIIIFAYIAFRFKKWQFGLGGVIALFHDATITISLYSLFYQILPFNMEVDQAFIAAILTIIGYSINDTVIIFDRIRENVGLHPKRDLKTNINTAINSTLARTLNTAGTTLVVLIAIFIFGGEVIRGFSFALLAGILVGTYSSIFVASPIAYDFIERSRKRRAAKEALKK